MPDTSPDATPIRLPTETAGVHHEHWCEHPGCDAWGSFGVTIKGETRWVCRAHKHSDN